MATTTSDFERGQAAAAKHGADVGWEAPEENRAFWDGFAAFMREQSNLAGNPDLDTFDF